MCIVRTLNINITHTGAVEDSLTQDARALLACPYSETEATSSEEDDDDDDEDDVFDSFEMSQSPYRFDSFCHQASPLLLTSLTALY